MRYYFEYEKDVEKPCIWAGSPHLPHLHEGGFCPGSPGVERRGCMHPRQVVIVLEGEPGYVEPEEGWPCPAELTLPSGSVVRSVRGYCEERILEEE